jgi:hypothetical protein
MTTAALQFHQQEAFESAAELRRLQGKLERAQSEVRQHCGTVIAARESEAPVRALIYNSAFNFTKKSVYIGYGSAFVHQLSEMAILWYSCAVTGFGKK